MGRRLIAVGGVALAFALACGNNEAETPAPEGEAPATTEAAAPAPAPAAAPEWTLASVDAGDASCYLQLTGADGSPVTMQADFELCPGGSHDATGSVGSRVTVATRKEKVMAPSCQGNPECTDSETVDLVVGLTVTGKPADTAPETCPTAALEGALADAPEIASAVNGSKLDRIKCNEIWATAHTVAPAGSDGAVVLFSRSAKGTWVAVNAGTGGVCDDVAEADQAALDCE